MVGNTNSRILLSNKNLIDNWYFPNPVNQRGITSVSGNVGGYFIDRWYMGDGTGSSAETCTVDSSGITMTSVIPGSGILIVQGLEDLAAGVYTISVSLGTVTASESRIMIEIMRSPWTDYGWLPVYPSDSNKIKSVTFTLSSPLTGAKGFYIQNLQQPGIINIKAVKLECGPISTLALDGPPIYATELKKCQRYALKLEVGNKYINEWISWGTYFEFLIPTPVSLRTVPTFTNGLAFAVMDKTGTLQGAYTSLSLLYTGSNCIVVRMTAPGASYVYDPVYLYVTSPGMISADL